MARKPRSKAPATVVKLQKRDVVQTAAATLREIILAREPGAQIGSLTEISKLLGVGIVTVQQAARVLEHEGLLDVRRGPGGGYYGVRPDEAALARSLAVYMRVRHVPFEEVTEMMSLLNSDIVPAAARCTDDALREEARALKATIDDCETGEARILFEEEFHKLLFKMNERPFVELLMRVAMNLFGLPGYPGIFDDEQGGAAVWKLCKHRMLAAIIAGDEALARFEANRYRDELLTRARSPRA